MANKELNELPERLPSEATDLIHGQYDSGADWLDFKMTQAGFLGNLPRVPGGRLTLTTGVSVTTSDVTAATTLYYALHNHDRIWIYDTGESRWKLHTFTERSISIPSTTDTNYDVFLYDNAGTLTIELVAWTNDTTRATAIVKQNGTYVKSGDASRVYLGTIRTTGVSGQCEDSDVSRFVWNFYNQVAKHLSIVDATVHTYNVATWRYYNNDSANRLQFVCGQAIIFLAGAYGLVGTSTDGNLTRIAVGVDSSSSGNTLVYAGTDHAMTSGTVVPGYGASTETLTEGYHFVACLQFGTTTGTHQFDRGGVDMGFYC